MSKATPSIQLDPPAGEIIEVAINEIELDHRNDRLNETHDQEAIDQLAASIEQVGLQQPVGVAPGSKPDRYRLVWGHRRLAAVKKLGLKFVRAVLKSYPNDDAIQVARAVENIHRQDLNPVEEAIAVAALIDAQDTPDDPKSMNAREAARARSTAIVGVANRLGKSQTWVRDRSFLAMLGPKERALVLEGRLPLGWARELCKVADPAERSALAQRAAAPAGDNRLPMDFSELRQRVAEQLRSLASVPWRLDVPFADAPACESCPHNSANQGGLFEHFPPANPGYHSVEAFKEPAAGVCLKAACFQEKSATSNRQIAAKGRSIAREIRELPKAERPAVTAVTLTTSAKLKNKPPEYLQPSKVAARVKEELERKPRPKSKASSSSSTTGQPKPKTPQQVAEDLHGAAMEDWREKAFEQLLECIAERPLTQATLAAIIDWPGLNWYGEKCRKELKKPDLRAAIASLAKPDLASIEAAWRRVGKNSYAVRDGLRDMSSVVQDEIIAALKVGGEPPKLEDFLAKAKADAAAAKEAEQKPAPQPSGKKKAKKGVATARSTQEVLDEEDGL